MELPKTLRQPIKSPSKGKKSEPVKQEPLFDYHEGLVHDTALRAHFQRAYETFKVFLLANSSVFTSADAVEGLDQTRVVHLDLGYFGPASSRTTARTVFYGLGVVLGYGRAA